MRVSPTADFVARKGLKEIRSLDELSWLLVLGPVR